MKAEVLLFSNFTSGGHQGGHPFHNFGFERHHDFEKKNKIFKIECSFLGGFGKWRHSLKYASDPGGVNESLEKYRCEL